MNKWLYINFGVKIIVIIWALFLVISPLFMFSSLLNSSVFANVIGFSLIGTALALGLIIWLYWNWSEIPVLFYLIFVTWLRTKEIIEIGGVPADAHRIAGSLYLFCLIGGIIIWQNS